MIVTRKYARYLIKIGKARYPAHPLPSVCTVNNRSYMIIDRIDKQRVDHYLTTVGDLRGGTYAGGLS